MNVLKGIAIGIANVIPGFSGGTMAVMVKIYDLFVYAFANFFNDFKNVIKKCWSLFVGIILGILIALVTIVKLLEVIPFITVMFFVGLIIGSIPTIYKKAKQGKLKIADIIGFIIAIVVIVGLPLLPQNDVQVSYNIGLYIILFVLGIICSSAMVIPGVSGSLVLMAFGYYSFVMITIKDLLKNLFNFSLDNYWNMFISIACFALGCLIGIVFISKLITKLTKMYPKTVFFRLIVPRRNIN
jgi:putative membrane protein